MILSYFRCRSLSVGRSVTARACNRINHTRVFSVETPPRRLHNVRKHIVFLHRKASLTCKTRVELDVGRLGGYPRRPSEKCSTVGLFCMAPRPAEAPWQVASWHYEGSTRSQLVLTLCVGKPWRPKCATVLQCSLVLTYRACKVPRQEGEDDSTENRPKT